MTNLCRSVPESYPLVLRRAGERSIQNARESLNKTTGHLGKEIASDLEIPVHGERRPSHND